MEVVMTPWGDASRLRRRRLSPGARGRNGMTADEVERHQRERLFAAAVSSVARSGYARSSVEELCRISGVARTDFYKYFDSRQDCFLATIDELQELGMARVRAGYRDGDDWEEKIRGAFDQLIGLLVCQPAAGHMYVVDVYEAGPQGTERARRGLAGFEALLARSFNRSPRHAGLPAEIIAAIVAGVQMVIHNRLRRGDVAELPRLAGELGDWALSYETPPEPLREGPRALVRPAGTDPDDDDARERIIRATAEICAGEGAPRLTVDAIAARARISLRTLYEKFPGGREMVFRGAFEEIVGRCLRCSHAAYDTEADWPARMHAVNHELFAYLASEPALAQTVLVEVLGAGPLALASRDRTLAPFEQLLEAGQRSAPAVPEVVREAVVFAIYSLVGREIEAGGGSRLTRLAPTATYLELAPYLGAEQAVVAANAARPNLSTSAV
jgi:AcrR family transcriptional regulator